MQGHFVYPLLFEICIVLNYFQFEFVKLLGHLFWKDYLHPKIMDFGIKLKGRHLPE